MPDTLPIALSIEAPDGQEQVLIQEGAQLPAETRAMFATQKPGERELALRLFEGAGKKRKLIGEARCELPAGLPANTWLATFVRVGADLRVSVEVRENLRRIREDAEIDASGAKSKHLTG